MELALRTQVKTDLKRAVIHFERPQSVTWKRVNTMCISCVPFQPTLVPQSKKLWYHYLAAVP